MEIENPSGKSVGFFIFKDQGLFFARRILEFVSFTMKVQIRGSSHILKFCRKIMVCDSSHISGIDLQRLDPKFFQKNESRSNSR